MHKAMPSSFASSAVAAFIETCVLSPTISEAHPLLYQVSIWHLSPPFALHSLMAASSADALLG